MAGCFSFHCNLISFVRHVLYDYQNDCCNHAQGNAVLTISRTIVALTLLVASMHGRAVATEANSVLGVVELFTSQSCGSCPPADQALQTLISNGEVIGLSYHVDYWDYLGWEDTLANRGNTDRQYEYAQAMGKNGVFTPQAVLNGKFHQNGSDITAIRRGLASDKAGGLGLAVPVNVATSRDQLDITVGTGQGNAEVVVVYFNHQSTVSVERGDNAGKTITYLNSVQDIQVIGNWEGREQSFSLPHGVLSRKKYDGLVVLLQRSDAKGFPTEIIGAGTLLTDIAQR